MEITSANQTLHNTARKLFGIVSSFDTEEAYVAMGQPKRQDLSRAIKKHVLDIAHERDIIPSGPKAQSRMNDFFAGELVATASQDTYNILRTSVFERYRDLSHESLNRIALNPLTTLTIAQIALRDASTTHNLINHHTNLAPIDALYLLNDTQEYITTKEALGTSYKNGCPFAGREGIVAPAPIFMKAIPVLGMLAINCHLTHSTI